MEVAVQVNGKVRAVVSLPTEAAPEVALTTAKADPRVQPYLDGKTVVREITVPNKLINFVVR